ncbi:hypothetical protein ACTGJ9_023785 [Bradyrhizobium sp. RDM12]
MRKIILGTATMTLIAASAPQALGSQALMGSQALAAQPQHHARKAPQATSEQFRDARNARRTADAAGLAIFGLVGARRPLR